MNRRRTFFIIFIVLSVILLAGMAIAATRSEALSFEAKNNQAKIFTVKYEVIRQDGWKFRMWRLVDREFGTVCYLYAGTISCVNLEK